MSSPQLTSLPLSTSPSLALRHPTTEECTQISMSTSTTWADALPSALYLKEQSHLATAPLAKDGGMTTWVLVDTKLSPDKRQILSSCETYRKRALISASDGEVQERIVHGVASVYCSEKLRGRGYAGRLLKELSKELRTWQTHNLPCAGSILYSDIGRRYYAKLGWHPNATNFHFELKPIHMSWPVTAVPIHTGTMDDLCQSDEGILRKSMAATSLDRPLCMTIIPDVEHMLWHHAKEEYACDFLFGKIPTAKGAIAGPPKNRVWAIWTHRYYKNPSIEKANNVLYILRLVIEADPTATRLPSNAHLRPSPELYGSTLESFNAVLQAAQAEAAEWKLDGVQIWDPTPFAKEMLVESGLEHVEVERAEEYIASLLWYDNEGGIEGTSPLWVNCEHYAWM